MTSATAKKIVIIDSGAGGLTVAKEIIKRRLNVMIHYIADDAYFPYGQLQDERLIDRQLYLVDRVHQHYQPDVVIVACNTASTLALPYLRERWQTEFIGVVPAIKPAVLESVSKRVGVLATQATIERDYLEKLIRDFAKNSKTYCIGSHSLVDLAENYVATGKIDKSILQSELNRLIDQDSNIDTIVLACTHFPILRSFFENELQNSSIRLIDSTIAIVNRLCQVCPSVNKTTVTARPTDIPKNSILFSNTGPVAAKHYAKFVDENSVFSPVFNINF